MRRIDYINGYHKRFFFWTQKDINFAIQSRMLKSTSFVESFNELEKIISKEEAMSIWLDLDFTHNSPIQEYWWRKYNEFGLRRK